MALSRDEEDLGGPETAERIRSFLLTRPGKVDVSLLDKISARVIKAQEDVSPEIKNARRLLQDYFKTHPLRKVVKDLGGDIILYGYLAHKEAEDSYPEVSVLAATRNSYNKLNMLDHIDKTREPLRHTINFNRDIDEPKKETVLFDFSLENTKEELPTTFNEMDLEQYELRAIELARVISGVPLFPQTQAWFDKFRADTIKTAESEPLLAALVNHELEKTLSGG